MDKGNVVSIHSEILFCQEKEGDSIICHNMDGPWGHYAKWNKLEWGKYYMISISFICAVFYNCTNQGWELGDMKWVKGVTWYKLTVLSPEGSHIQHGDLIKRRKKEWKQEEQWGNDCSNSRKGWSKWGANGVNGEKGHTVVCLEMGMTCWLGGRVRSAFPSISNLSAKYSLLFPLLFDQKLPITGTIWRYMGYLLLVPESRLQVFLACSGQNLGQVVKTCPLYFVSSLLVEKGCLRPPSYLPSLPSTPMISWTPVLCAQQGASEPPGIFFSKCCLFLYCDLQTPFHKTHSSSSGSACRLTSSLMFDLGLWHHHPLCS